MAIIQYSTGFELGANKSQWKFVRRPRDRYFENSAAFFFSLAPALLWKHNVVIKAEVES